MAENKGDEIQAPGQPSKDNEPPQQIQELQMPQQAEQEQGQEQEATDVAQTPLQLQTQDVDGNLMAHHQAELRVSTPADSIQVATSMVCWGIKLARKGMFFHTRNNESLRGLL